jgi:hypothetical protein
MLLILFTYNHCPKCIYYNKTTCSYGLSKQATTVPSHVRPYLPFTITLPSVPKKHTETSLQNYWTKILKFEAPRSSKRPINFTKLHNATCQKTLIWSCIKVGLRPINGILNSNWLLKWNVNFILYTGLFLLRHLFSENYKDQFKLHIK